MSPWQELDVVLRRWADAGRAASFWLRDDDAVEPTAALDQLLELTGSDGIPLALAVIPAHAGAPLAARLRDEAHVTVVLHGWAHRNHAPAGEKKQEFGPHRAHEVMLAELAAGRTRLSELFGSTFFPLFVPPWNRIDPTLVPRLPEAGLTALSAFGPEKTSIPRTVNSNVDVIDWHGTRGGRDPDALIGEILAQLDRIAAGKSTAVGILTHHLVHDAAAWDFLERLFDLTADHPGCRWRSVRELIAEA
jgi:hypothetical protein